LGTYQFTADTPARVTLINQAQAGKRIFADAVYFNGGAAPPIQPPTPQEIRPGVFHSVWNLPGPIVVHALEFDLDSTSYTLQMGFPQRRRNYSYREATSRIAEQYNEADNEVIGAVNAGFFFGGIGIHGLLGSDSNVIAPPTPDVVQETYMLQESEEGWAGMRVSAATGAVRFAGGQESPLGVLNNTCTAGVIALYTPDWGPATGTSTEGVEVIIDGINFPFRYNKNMEGVIMAVRTGGNSVNNTIPPMGAVLRACAGAEATLLANAREGDAISFRFDLSRRMLDNARLVVNGSGWIVRDRLPHQSEGDTRHPRTVIAWSGRRHWFLAFDGRQPGYSVGASVREIADFVIRGIQADNAINLDGGGSTTMVVDGAVVNCPSDGAVTPCTGVERAVSNALLLVRRPVVSPLPLHDAFTTSGPSLAWDEKRTRNRITLFSPPAPDADGAAAIVKNPRGGLETMSIGGHADEDYFVEAWVYCDVRAEVAADGFERVGLFARDDGNANFDGDVSGPGNCYALAFDTDTGRVRAARMRNYEMTDFLEPTQFFLADDGWRLFRVECEGNRIRFRVDGETVADVTDDAHPRGRAGLASHSYFQTDGLAEGGVFEEFRMADWEFLSFEGVGSVFR